MYFHRIDLNVIFSAGLGGAQYQIPMAMPGAVPRLQYPGLIGQQQAAALQGWVVVSRLKPVFEPVTFNSKNNWT